MKEDLKLFWQNIYNNKYYVPLILFAVFAVVAIVTINDFDSKVAFWFIEGFCIICFFVVIIGSWVTKDSQK